MAMAIHVYSIVDVETLIKTPVCSRNHRFVLFVMVISVFGESLPVQPRGFVLGLACLAIELETVVVKG